MRRVWMVIGLVMAVLLAGSATVLARGPRPHRHKIQHVVWILMENQD